MRRGKSGKTVTLEIGIWYNEETGHIHMAASDAEGFITTVAPNQDSKRGHPNLFRKLAKRLRDAGAPHPVIEDADDT